jgi:hypothetical protein
MHNVHGCHASRETTTNRLEASDSICRHGGGEERDGSSRLLLSQPAVSRALQRARGMFQDDRHMASNSPSGAARVSKSYRGYYPRWRISLRRSGSIQRGRRATFVISGPDNICTVVLPRLLRQYAKGRYQVQFEFLPWQSGIAESVGHGQVELVLHIDDGLLPFTVSLTQSVQSRCRARG